MVAHLDEVLDGKLGDHIRVWLTLIGKLQKNRSKIAVIRAEHFIEQAAIFEAGVDALAVKRHDRMSGVADEQGASVVPRRAANLTSALVGLCM